MESIAPFEQDNKNHQQPTTSQTILFPQPSSTQKEALATSSQQNTYQVKCNLLEYHIQEAILINKALRSEVKQYKEKIDFEKKLRKFLVNRVKGHSDRVWTLAWNPAGTILASSGSDKTIRLWSRENDKWICVSILTETHSKSIRRICWSPCGQYLASASFDSTVCIWKRNSTDGSWITVVNLDGHENEVKSVAWSHDGRYLASCGRDRTVWIWERDFSNDNGSGEDESAENWDCSDVKNDHSKDVKHIVWHPKHNILVSCSYDDSIKFFHKQADDWKCYETLASHTSTVWSADFSSSGEYLATCGDDRTVRVWKNHAHGKLPNVEPNSWKCISVIQGYHSRTIYDVSWSKIDNIIVSASGDNSLIIYSQEADNVTNNEAYTCTDKMSLAHECDVNSVVWNNVTSGLLASGSDDCSIKLWSYIDSEKGMRPLSITDEILKTLDIQSDPKAQQSEKSTLNVTKNVTDFSTLLTLTQSLQRLQNELVYDKEESQLAKLLDLQIEEENPQPIRITGIQLSGEGFTDELTVEIIDERGSIIYRFILKFDKSTFNLAIPRRSSNLLTIANQIFLYEKTGDLYKILDSGASQFLLGHLFMFSDVKFVTTSNSNEIAYIISADRDEKIRISSYPKTFKIERYCFGHKYLVRRLFLVDKTRFLSIDHQNVVCLWDIRNINKLEDSQLIVPHKTMTLDDSAKKRFCSDENFHGLDKSSDYEISSN